jgi:pyroglutamyl-peptidase
VLLLMGFEPFAGEPVNPSLELARALHGERIGGLRVVAQPLPCSFGATAAALDAALARWSPRLVVVLGQAGGRCELAFERVAINLVDAPIPDNAGEQPVDTPVVPGGPAAYFSSLPVKAMVAAARAAGVPASVSLSAGSYVCNQAFYALMHRLAAGREPVPGGFVHLPWLPEQASRRAGQPSMPLATMALGLRAALAAACARPGGGGDLAEPAGFTH